VQGAEQQQSRLKIRIASGFVLNSFLNTTLKQSPESGIMTIILRPDQQQLKQGVVSAWQSGARNVCAVLPTGGGKSIVLSDLILDGHKAGARQIVIAHRTELVSQMSLHVARRGIKHRIIGPNNVVSQIINEHRRELGGRSFINPDAACAVAGIDTLVARADDLTQWAKQIDCWYGDEGHHFLAANKWGSGTALFTNARGLLVTATPQRADGAGLGRHADGIADAMVIGLTMRELINIGALSDYEIVIPESDFHIDEDAIGTTGDFSPKKMREASKASHIVGDVVKEYIRHASGKRAICFATDVETSVEIAANFNAAGVPAISVSAKTPAEVRADAIRRFKDGRCLVLVNVDLFGEGFDVPACEVVIMARPTASLAVYMQQFGRAMRVIAGKAFGLVIDHVSNYKRHGFPDKPRAWTLDRREKSGKREKDPEEIPLTACRECSKPYERVLPACPHCGFAPEVSASARREIECIDGDLILLDREKLAEMRKAAELESPAAIGERVAFAAGPIAGKRAVNLQIERIGVQRDLSDAIAQWAGVQRAKGRGDQESYRRFYYAAGMDVLSALALPRADMETMLERVRGWLGLESVQKKSLEEHLIEQAIAKKREGFRDGWLYANSVAKLLRLKGNSGSKIIAKILKNMGFVSHGQKWIKVALVTVYHKDPNAIWNPKCN